MPLAQRLLSANGIRAVARTILHDESSQAEIHLHKCTIVFLFFWGGGRHVPPRHPPLRSETSQRQPPTISAGSVVFPMILLDEKH